MVVYIYIYFFSFCLCYFRKKKKNKESKHHLEQVVSSQNDEEVKTKKAYVDKRTPAQMAFDKMQEKRVSSDPHQSSRECD